MLAIQEIEKYALCTTIRNTLYVHSYPIYTREPPQCSNNVHMYIRTFSVSLREDTSFMTNFHHLILGMMAGISHHDSEGNLYLGVNGQGK